MTKTVLLHIELPKTGSTSVQRLMKSNVLKLQEQGFDIYRAEVLSHNCGELPFTTVREGLTTFQTGKFPDVDRDALFVRTRTVIHDFVAASRMDRLIFSNENLSNIRTPEECGRLKALFPSDVRFEVYLVLREPKEWLRSYASQIRKHPNRHPSDDPASAFYVEPDSWLADFEGLKACFARNVGPVTTIDYDPKAANSTLLKAFGVTPWDGVDGFRENVSHWNKPLWSRIRQRVALRTRLRRRWAELRRN
jgi:hypothetical protein